MNSHLLLFSFFVSGILISCSKSSSSDWLIDETQVFDGGPGKDGIPSVDNPQFTTVDQADFLTDEDLIVGMIQDNQMKAYPHSALNWHEIVNDEIANHSYAITYCPLTGTGIAWNRTLNGNTTTFGVSGLLYNTNLMPYDRNTNSTWSQQRLDCVNGGLIGTRIQTYPLIETTFSTWKRAFPESLIMTRETGYSINYESYPYGDYIINNDRFLFPVNNMDWRLPSKQRVLGVLISGKVKAYPFGSKQETNIIYDSFQGENIFILRSVADNFIIPYKTNTANEYEVLQDQYPAVFNDQLGNVYNLAGEVIQGPAPGKNLESPEFFIGYWFSWGAFYPDIELYIE